MSNYVYELIEEVENKEVCSILHSSMDKAISMLDFLINKEKGFLEIDVSEFSAKFVYVWVTLPNTYRSKTYQIRKIKVY